MHIDGALRMNSPETEIIVTKDGEELLRTKVTPGDYVIGRETGGIGEAPRGRTGNSAVGTRNEAGSC